MAESDSNEVSGRNALYVFKKRKEKRASLITVLTVLESNESNEPIRVNLIINKVWGIEIVNAPKRIAQT